MRMARRVKSLSLETRQNPPNSRVCSKSIASIISALSLAFFPTVLRNCWTGWIACSSSTARQLCRLDVVKSPYTRLTLAVPSEATSERISPITAAEALSASIKTASRRESSGIFYDPPLFMTACLALADYQILQSDRLCSPAAVDADGLAGDEGGLFRGEVGDPRGDLVGLAEAAHRDCLGTLAEAGFEIVAVFAAVGADRARGADRAGADRIDGDAEGREVERQRFREADDRRLRGGVGRAFRAGAERCLRRDADDAAPAGLAHVRDGGTRHQEAALGVDAQRQVPGGDRHVLDLVAVGALRRDR